MIIRNGILKGRVACVFAYLFKSCNWYRLLKISGCTVWSLRYDLLNSLPLCEDVSVTNERFGVPMYRVASTLKTCEPLQQDCYACDLYNQMQTSVLLFVVVVRDVVSSNG